MKVAVEGCCHGELDKIYETIQYLEQVNNIKVDLLLICGDFQAVRNKDDLKAMAVPPKYQKLNTFYKYYSGEKVAPVLTIFIGGNHEASNYMQELSYGGWVAKNIFYMGYANVIEVGGLRIGGLSGIYKARDYNRGHYEYPPYTEDTKRSVYHIRNVDVFRLKQLSRPLDIVMSHDWPKDIARYGPMEQLFRKKAFLRDEVMDGSLGSPPAAELLHKLQPSYWFSAHLHVKYGAVVEHSGGKCTKFLSLDKCLPRRKFLQVLDFPDREAGPVKITLDPEWLCVLKSTNHLMSLERTTSYMPGPGSTGRNNFEVTDKDIEDVKEVFGGNLTLPENFETTAPTLSERNFKPASPPVMVNPQTALLCTMLDLTDPNAVRLGLTNNDTIASQLGVNAEELDITNKDDDDSGSTDDDVPSDVNSSLDTSWVNSSFDMSDSFSGRQHRKNLAPEFSVSGSASPLAKVDDDNEEFKAILAAQRRKSCQGNQKSDGTTDKPSDDKSALSSDSDSKVSSTPKPELSEEEEFAAIMAAQKHQNSQTPMDLDSEKGKNDEVEFTSSQSQDKSSSDLDSTSQDSSQDELDRVGSQATDMHSNETSCLELSTEGQRLSVGNGFGSPAMKRLSPDLAGGGTTSAGKKLKRRNVSMYSSSGTEEDTC